MTTMLHTDKNYDAAKAKLAEAWSAMEKMATGQKNDPPLTPAGPYLHGPAGLFNDRNLANPVISAIMTPLGGVVDELPVLDGSRMLGGEYGGLDANFVTMLTGVTAGDLDSFDNQPTAACADGPVGGLMKLCSIVNSYGNYVMSTREVEIDRAGRLADRCDQFTAQLANMPAFAPMFAKPTTTPSLNNAINNELAARIWEMVISHTRMFAPRVWTGSPTNNSGERRDILGLETQINVNTHVDALSSAICHAADPDVKDFNYSQITGNAKDIIQYLEMMDNYVRWNARKQGLTIDDAFIAMRPELWLVLTEVVTVRQYQAAMAQMAHFQGSGGRLMVDARAAQTERNQMRNTMLIPLNGRMVRVVEDDTIPEDNVTTNANLQAGQYASDVYFIPTRVNGIPVTYWETWNHDNMQSRTIQQYAGPYATFSTDGGKFRWHANYKNGCLKLNVKFKPRLMMHTPQLAYRLQNVAYEPLQHLRTFDPNDANYFFNGGRSEGDTQTYYSPWSPSTPVQL